MANVTKKSLCVKICAGKWGKWTTLGSDEDKENETKPAKVKNE